MRYEHAKKADFGPQKLPETETCLQLLQHTYLSLGRELPLTLMVGMGTAVRESRRKEGNQILLASAKLKQVWPSHRASSGSVTAMLRERRG